MGEWVHSAMGVKNIVQNHFVTLYTSEFEVAYLTAPRPTLQIPCWMSLEILLMLRLPGLILKLLSNLSNP